MGLRLLVSIHDVMPATLGRVERIFGRLLDAGLSPVTLLVVPGTGWQREHLDRLREMVALGAELAGHGWRHEARQIRGFKHRLHSALISRRAGEHLALSAREILRLMLENRRWFARHELPAPDLYVPPAWAMGPVPRHILDRLPFDRYETLAGVYEVKHQRFYRLPMAGFEADTAFRAVTVRAFNRINRAWAGAADRPLRLGIHPDDFELRLSDDLAVMLKTGGMPLSYTALGCARAA